MSAAVRSLVLVLVLASPAGAQPDPREAAVRAFQAGDLEGAEGMCRAWLERHPRDLEVWLLLGMMRVTAAQERAREGRPSAELLPLYRGAAEPLLRAEGLAAGRRLANLDHALGQVYLADGRLPEAVERLTRALEQRPGHTLLLRLRGQALSELGRYDEAERDLKAAVQANPDDPAARLLRAQNLFYLGREQEARAGLAEYYGRIEDRPKDTRHRQVLFEMFRYSKLMNDYAQMRSLLEALLRLDPAHLSARAELGLLLYREGDFAGAERELDRVLQAEAPRRLRVEALHHKGLMAQQRGDFDEARRLFESALALSPNRADTLQNHAAALRRLGRPHQAASVLERFRRVVDLDNQARGLRSQLLVVPRDRDARVRLVRLLLDLGRADEAGEHLQTLKRTHPADPALGELEVLLAADP